MISIKASDIRFDKAIFSKFEKEIGLHFTVEYTNFIEKYNGGIPESNIVRLRQNSDDSSISITSFLGVGLESYDNIIEQYNLLKGRIPKGCVPIANTEGGNVICINLNSQMYGYIFLWNHEEEVLYDYNEIKLSNLYLIANSFEEFLNTILPYNSEDDDLGDYEVQEVWVDSEFLKELDI